MAPISSLKNKLLSTAKPAAKPPAPAPKPAAPAPKPAIKAPAPAPRTTVAQHLARTTSQFQKPVQAPRVTLNPTANAPRAPSAHAPVNAAEVIRRGPTAFNPSITNRTATNRTSTPAGSFGGPDNGFVPRGSEWDRAHPRAQGGDLASSNLRRLTGPESLRARLALGGAKLDANTALGVKLKRELEPGNGLGGIENKLGKDKALAALKGKLSLDGASGLDGGFNNITADAAERQAEVDRTNQTAAQRAEAVEDAYAAGGAQAAAEELDAQTEALGDDQAAVDALIRASQPTIDKIAEDTVQDSGDGVQARTEATINALSHVADRASDAGVDALVQPLAEALPNVWPGTSNYAQVPFNAANVRESLEGLADKGEGTRISLALGARLDALGKQTAREINTAAFHSLDVAQTRYDDARTARENADAELAAQLSELSGTLTEEEQQAYIEEYHRRHEDVYAAEVDAATALDAAVAPNVALIDDAVIRNPARAQQVVDVMSSLASSPVPAAATEWGINAFQDGSPTAEVYEQYADDIRTNVVEKGLAGTLTQYQAEAGGNADAALAKFDNLFKGLRAARGLFGDPSQYQKAVEQAQQFMTAIDDWRKGNTSTLKSLLSSDTVKGLTGVGAAFAAAGVAFGILNAANATEADQLALAAGQAGRAGLELFAAGVASLSNSSRLALKYGAGAAESAAGLANFLQTRLIPGLSVGVNIIATKQAFEQARNDPSLANVIGVVGNAISLLSSVVSLIPGLQVVGKIGEAIGQGVAWLGQAIFGEGDEARNNEQQHILEKLWRNDPYFQENPEQLGIVAGRIADNGEFFEETQEEGNLTREQMFELIYRVGPNSVDALPELTEVAASVGLSGEALIDQLDQLAEREGGLIYAQTIIQDALNYLVTNPPATEAERIARLQALATALEIDGPRN